MALRRDAYLAVGGMQHQYGRFAEMLLAAALRDSGNELGYASESVVTHHYRETLQEIIDGTDEYVASECGYRAANPGPDRVGHSYFPELSNPFSPGATALTREVAATLLKGILGNNTFLKRKALSSRAEQSRDSSANAGRCSTRGSRSRPVVYGAGKPARCNAGGCPVPRTRPARLDPQPHSPSRDATSNRSAVTSGVARIAISTLPEWALFGLPRP